MKKDKIVKTVGIDLMGDKVITSMNEEESYT